MELIQEIAHKSRPVLGALLAAKLQHNLAVIIDRVTRQGLCEVNLAIPSRDLNILCLYLRRLYRVVICDIQAIVRISVFSVKRCCIIGIHYV